MAENPDLPAADPGGARQHSQVSGVGHVVVQIVGDGNTVLDDTPHLLLTRYLNRRLADGENRGEAALLSPYSLAIPLVGREVVLSDLWTWMNVRQRISVRVVMAKAGAGKTRLALTLCEEATEAGWGAGFLTDGEMVRFRGRQNLSFWNWDRPTLIVVDYAAARARTLHDWLVELADHLDQEGPPLRLLLLERHADPAGGWWREAFGVGGGDTEAIARLLDPVTGPYALSGLVEPQDRRRVLASILQRSGSQIRLPEDPSFDRQLAEISWGGEPLFLLMAGLVAARAGFGEVLALSAPDLGLLIAGHEIQRIHDIAESRNLSKTFLAHLAAYITLYQGLTDEELEAAIEDEKAALGYSTAGDLPEIFGALADALPVDSGTVAPILPDVVGEAVVLEALGGGRGGEKAFGAVYRAAQRSQERVTASLVRLAQDYGHVRPEPLVWFERLAEKQKGDLEGLDSLLAQLPARSLVFRESAATLTARAVELAREQTKPETLAWLLNDQSIRLSALGRREEALAACEEAITIRVQLAAVRPDTFRLALAIPLNNLSILLGALGRREEALAACKEATQLYRQLAVARPEAFRAGLATSLNNLSSRLSALGCRDEALAACKEAITIWGQLAAVSPGVFRPDLAMSLNNLSNFQSALGRREEALATGKEAAQLYRELAVARPDVFRTDLASALYSLSHCLSALGCREEALATCEEAVTIWRQLAAARPDAFQPELASALNNLSVFLNALGRRKGALAACVEAVTIQRQLASARPDAFQPDLAMSLNNLSNRLSDIGRGEEALVACEEGVEIRRQLATVRPDAFQPDLAMSLNNLSRCLGALGRWEKALAACEEAVAIQRQLAAAQPDAFRPNLAMSLNNLSNLLSALGRREEALVACEEAVAIRRQLAAVQPDAFRPNLANTLNSLSNHLSALGRLEEALSVSEEAVRTLYPHFLAYPAALRNWMKTMINNYRLLVEQAGQTPNMDLLSRLEALLGLPEEPA